MTLTERKQWQPVREAIELPEGCPRRVHDADAVACGEECTGVLVAQDRSER